MIKPLIWVETLRLLWMDFLVNELLKIILLTIVYPLILLKICSNYFISGKEKILLVPTFQSTSKIQNSFSTWLTKRKFPTINFLYIYGCYLKFKAVPFLCMCEEKKHQTKHDFGTFFLPTWYIVLTFYYTNISSIYPYFFIISIPSLLCL